MITELNRETSKSICFDGKQQKPIQWIGTQRTPFTHRKKQVRIKEVMAKTKANLEKPQTPLSVKENDPADDVDMEESDSQVTVFVVKNKALTKSGLG